MKATRSLKISLQTGISEIYIDVISPNGTEGATDTCHYILKYLEDQMGALPQAQIFCPY